MESSPPQRPHENINVPNEQSASAFFSFKSHLSKHISRASDIITSLNQLGTTPGTSETSRTDSSRIVTPEECSTITYVSRIHSWLNSLEVTKPSPNLNEIPTPRQSSPILLSSFDGLIINIQTFIAELRDLDTELLEQSVRTLSRDHATRKLNPKKVAIMLAARNGIRAVYEELERAVVKKMVVSGGSTTELDTPEFRKMVLKKVELIRTTLSRLLDTVEKWNRG